MSQSQSSRLNFKLEKTAQGSRARATSFRTLHNEVRTPLFMPVGTHAAVRGQRREDLLAADAQILLANTYHLFLRPGVETFKQFGDIHRFMNWPKSVLTDSGGFQIFCLPNSRIMKEEGAYFKSYVDHQTYLLSPEVSIETQKAIGSDIMMVLDQCVPSTVDRATAKAAMELTHRWAKRSLKTRGDSPQSMFGIVQGACYEDLRKESAKVITDMPFDGFAIGGLAVGESQREREDCTAIVTDLLPQDRPRYLMGVGTTLDLLEAVHRGVDMFDCILPTAMAQQGKAFTSVGRKDLRRSAYRTKDEPLDETCQCYTCKTYSVAYLAHLHRVHESQAWQLIGIHNVHFYMNLMRQCREHILNDTWMPFYNTQRELLDQRDSYGPKTVHFSNIERKKNALRLGRFEVVTRDQISRILDHQSSEIMHSVNDPQVEAKELYVDQSRLTDLLQRPLSSPVVVWDVGLGAASNAMAAIAAFESLKLVIKDQNPSGKIRDMVMVSFENDLDSLRLALKFPARFPHLKHPAPHQVILKKLWTSKKDGTEDAQISWQLLEGDFLELFKTADRPDVVFYDPFSAKHDTPLWTVECFRQILEFAKDHPFEMFTYSASTAVRATLLAAGFFVAKGVSTGPKSETTIALSPSQARRDHGRNLLDLEWLSRWSRSDAKIPLTNQNAALTTSDKESLLALIDRHGQFSEN